jgi:hypothetical protein
LSFAVVNPSGLSFVLNIFQKKTEKKGQKKEKESLLSGWRGKAVKVFA